jgi:hypothetical protein
VTSTGNPELDAILATLRLVAKLGPEVWDAARAVVDAMRAGKDPTPAERHLQVVAALKLLEIQE